MDPRSLTKDFREFLQCLNARGVEFLVQTKKDLADLDHLP
jgi:hypothetical protein